VSICVGSAWKILLVTARSLWSWYIKATVVFVCVGSAWKTLPITTRSLWSCETQISFNKTVPPNLRAQKILIKLSPAFCPGGGGGRLERRFFFSSCIWCGEWTFHASFIWARGGRFIFLSANGKA